MKKLLALASVVTGVFLAFPAWAGTYQGGGYTITINGFGGSASYEGCDSQGNCLYIPQASHYTQGHYTWENGGYTYNMSPLNANDGRYRLKVFAPSGKLLLNTIVSPVN